MNASTPRAACEVELFERLVHERTGIVTNNRRGDLANMLAELAKLHRCELRALYDAMASSADGGELFQELIDKVTVNETHFFRNTPQFEALEKRILPDLIQKRRSVRTLRIWSAGCSTGEEPYSIAALLHRILPDLASWRILILATDISHHALNVARAGLYGNWSFRQTPPSFRSTWFQPKGKKSQISSTLMKMVTFNRLNLAENSYPSISSQTCNMDIILCRNVFIYFDADTTAAIINRLYHAAVDGGWLLVGHSEPSALFSQFGCHELPGTTVYQKKQVASVIADLTLAPVPPAAETQAPSEAAPMPVIKEEIRAADVRPPRHSIDEVEQWISAGRLDDALRELNDHIRFQPDVARTRCLAAKVYSSQMKLPNASEQIQKALEIEPLNVICHFVQGLIHQETGNTEGAIASYRRCTFLQPDFLLAQYMTALALRRRGEFSHAARLARQLDNALRQMKPSAKIQEGDGLTAGQMLKLVQEWKTHD
jgi:chemotaxis protein methyltransferase CheR